MIKKTLTDSPRFAKKHNIVDYAKSVRLEIKVTPKDSKARAVKIFMTALGSASPSIQSRAIERILSDGGKQTEGWIELITNGQ